MLKSLILVLFCLTNITIAIPINDDRIVFQDEDSGDFQNEILVGNNKDNFRLDPTLSVQKELENGKLFQGDIILHGDQKDLVMSHMNFSEAEENLPTRTGIIGEQYRWPKNDYGLVELAYVIDPSSGYSSNQREVIRHAMYILEYYTCVRFVERTHQEDYVRIFSGDGCYSHLGKIGGKQDVSLRKNGCMGKGTIMHEFIHALGYDHMHSHADRDKHVKIMFQNIKQDAISNFDKVSPRLFSNFGTTYDVFSVMHYDSKAFSKNGKETIAPRNLRFSKIIGQREGLSRGDITRVNNMYECPPFDFNRL
jgi:hypothetical protein